MGEYLTEVRKALSSHLSPAALKVLSTRLQTEFQSKLQDSDISFLPSYHHTLPSGSETGTFLALDVGGSNFRLALISLHTRSQPTDDEQTRVLHTLTFPIDASVRALRGHAFFKWMADRIKDMLDSCPSITSQFSTSSPLQMGLAWSFPVHATSQRSGYLLAMGKGFSAVIGVQGQDLSRLIMTPCHALRLPVNLATVINDGSASLLSQAYRESTTRMSLILGTGTNSSIYLPVSALSPSKLGERPQSWLQKARRVCVNTELSMHGGDIWPLTPWDEKLNAAHERPGFQPFEHFVGGRYLGEIVRLILLDAIAQGDLFDGETPQGLEKAYGLDSGVLAAFAAEGQGALEKAGRVFAGKFGMERGMTKREAGFVRDVAEAVAERAAAYEAAAVHALWELRGRSEAQMKFEEGQNGIGKQGASQVGERNGLMEERNSVGMEGLSYEQMKVTIACNGSILEKYPGFRARCQRYIDALTALSVQEMGSEPEGRLVELSMALESSMFGAAVAAACCLDEE
ncbi:Hexokinase-like protein 2 [Elsinoe fawcettii]|nr:Hexokinase-like protein 2 [Elsinoe fawcettii]